MTNEQKFRDVFPDTLVWFTNGNVVGVNNDTVQRWAAREYSGESTRDTRKMTIAALVFFAICTIWAIRRLK